MHILESLRGTYKHKWVGLTFFPGISRKQASQAALSAYERVNEVFAGGARKVPAGGGPRITENELAELRRHFVQIGLPQNKQGLRPADQLRKVKASIADSQGSIVKDVSQSTIANQYRAWRTTQGLPPRNYHKD